MKIKITKLNPAGGIEGVIEVSNTHDIYQNLNYQRYLVEINGISYMLTKDSAEIFNDETTNKSKSKYTDDEILEFFVIVSREWAEKCGENYLYKVGVVADAMAEKASWLVPDEYSDEVYHRIWDILELEHCKHDVYSFNEKKLMEAYNKYLQKQTESSK